jgi:hypothetical protein
MRITNSTPVEHVPPTGNRASWDNPSDGALEVARTRGAMLATQVVEGTVFTMVLRLNERLLDEGPSIGEIMAQGKYLSAIEAGSPLGELDELTGGATLVFTEDGDGGYIETRPTENPFAVCLPIDEVLEVVDALGHIGVPIDKGLELAYAAA